jgi:hypothetical protein
MPAEQARRHLMGGSKGQAGGQAGGSR